MKKTFRQLAALLLPIVLLLSTFHIPATAKSPAELRVAVIADTHMYPDWMTGDFCDAFRQDNSHKGRPAELPETLFIAALDELTKQAKQQKFEYLFVAGDITRDGEYEGHVRAAQLLRQFEKDTGVPVAVVPGNHDINKGNAADYSSGKREQARNLSPGEFLELYGQLGYDLPGCERFELSYAADLGRGYRLIAIDTTFHRADNTGKISLEELCDWVVAQCAKAKAAGKTIVGLGHHNLAEQLGGQETILRNFGFDEVRPTAEAFADAGMHFYFSGHLHLGEIAMRVSDSGAPLYDICVPSTASFPNDYRYVHFSTAGKQIKANVRSHAIPFKVDAPYDHPYYKTLFGLTFGADLVGGGLAGNIKARVKGEITDFLGGLNIPGGIETIAVAAVNNLLDEVAAFPVSELPCSRFVKEYGFGDPNRPGTVEDLANSAIVYMFGKNHDPADDPFMQDVLRRLQSGEFLDKLLAFAVPKVLEILSGNMLTALINSPAVLCALDGLLTLVVSPAKRAVLSDSLYHAAGNLIASQSPIGSRDGVLTYSGHVKVPTDPGTYRLPQDLSVRARGLTSAEITWYARQSVSAPELKITDIDGNPAPEVKLAISSRAEELTVDQLDIGFAKILGRTQPVLKHTARLTGLKPGKAYLFTAGDSKWDWWSEAHGFTASRL